MLNRDGKTEMADSPTHFDSGDEGVGPGRQPNVATSRWRITAWIVIGVVVLAVFIALHLTGVIGPGSH